MSPRFPPAQTQPAKGPHTQTALGMGLEQGLPWLQTMRLAPQCQLQSLGKALLHGQVLLQNQSSLVLSHCSNKPHGQQGKESPTQQVWVNKEPFERSAATASAVLESATCCMAKSQSKRLPERTAATAPGRASAAPTSPQGTIPGQSQVTGPRAGGAQCMLAPPHECSGHRKVQQGGIHLFFPLRGILELIHFTNARLELIPPKY